MLDGKILPTLLRLAVPNVMAMGVAVLVGIAETRYVGLLGTVPLAAMALVFPFVMLMQMMSAGAMGGGVSSAVSRALGASDLPRAQSLALHALVVGLVAGTLHGAIFILFGPTLYHWLGGRDEVLAQAVAYSTVVFLAAAPIWVMNALISVLRGSGNMRVPSLVVLVTSTVQILVGGALGLGLGPFPRWGMAGVAIGSITAFSLGSLWLGWYLLSGRGTLRMRLWGVPLQWSLFSDILRVGALACLSPVQSVLAILVVTGLVARLGMVSLAGYSIGQRLEFLLIPIAFGVGVAAVPMVGMAIGAGRIARARRVAWIAASVSGCNLAAVGLLVALYPNLWAGLFTHDPEVLDAASQYLRWAGPGFGFFGFGLTLYFAAQGSGKILGPVLASTVRLLVVAGFGAWLITWIDQAWPLFALVGAAMLVYGVASALAVRWTPWDPR